MLSTGWLFLAAMIAAYGVANLLQSFAAARTPTHRKFHPALLLRLASHRTYLVGVGCQFAGFLLAFLARRELPLFLVQAAMAAGLGVTAVLGVLFLKWRVPVAEIVLLTLLGAGLAGVIVSAEPAPSRQIGVIGDVALAVAVGLIALTGLFAARLHGGLGSVILGGLAGLAFGAAAVASRPLAGAHGWGQFVTDPLLYLLLLHTVLGQLLLGLAMQRGATTAAVASMDAAAAAPAAVIGVLFLGDRISPGLGWLAWLGFLLTLGSVIALTRYAKPQHGPTHDPAHEPESEMIPAPLPPLPAPPPVEHRVTNTAERRTVMTPAFTPERAGARGRHQAN